jgi:UDP-glucose 4-epimerase
MKILVTGASGFVGSSLCTQLSLDGYHVLPVNRRLGNPGLVCGNIDEATNWAKALVGIDTVVHTAARVHIMKDSLSDPLAGFREVNVGGTLKLARQAASLGVKRFIYISSIKVNGESTTRSNAFTEKDVPSPLDPYGVSKYEAEEGLKKISAESDMEVVIIRPPLVYGAGVKANFLNLLKLSSTRIPLPFGLIRNKRSMVYVENLVDFIVKCIYHPAAANQTFLVSDNYDLSLRNLLFLMRKSLYQPSRLVPVPIFLFNLTGFLFHKKDVIDRLVGDLQVNPSKAMTLLNWKPPYTVDQGIQNTVDSFLKDKK